MEHTHFAYFKLTIAHVAFPLVMNQVEKNTQKLETKRNMFLCRVVSAPFKFSVSQIPLKLQGLRIIEKRHNLKEG